MRSKIEAKLRKIMLENLELIVPIEQLTITDDITNIGINSLSFIKLIVALEVEFDIEFDEDKLNMENSTNMKTIIDYIESSIHY